MELKIYLKEQAKDLITPRFDTGFNPVGSFHTHLKDDILSPEDIITLMKDTKEDINKKRTTFSNSIMGIGGIPGNNIKFYIPKILYGIRSP